MQTKTGWSSTLIFNEQNEKSYKRLTSTKAERVFNKAEEKKQTQTTYWKGKGE